MRQINRPKHIIPILVKDEDGKLPSSTWEKIKVIEQYFKKTIAPPTMTYEFLSTHPSMAMKEKFTVQEIKVIAKRLGMTRPQALTDYKQSSRCPQQSTSDIHLSGWWKRRWILYSTLSLGRPSHLLPYCSTKRSHPRADTQRPQIIPRHRLCGRPDLCNYIQETQYRHPKQHTPETRKPQPVC